MPTKRGTASAAGADAPVADKKSLTSDAKIDMTRFAEYDSNGNGHLEFLEFWAMMPTEMQTKFGEDKIQSWFDAADRDGDGIINIHDYWRWSLGKLAYKHGIEMLRSVFSGFDADGTGVLDSLEFEQAATAMGFGNVAHAIFRDLDDDGSGTVTYGEMISNLMEGRKALDAPTQQLHKTLASTYDQLTKEDRVIKIDTSNWAIQGGDPTTVLEKLRTYLSESGAHIIDLINVFDHDADMKLCLDELEFYATLKKVFGFQGPLHVLQGVFQTLDSDASGQIGYDDLFEFVRGRQHSLDNRAKDVRWALEPLPQQHPETGDEFTPKLDELAWDSEVLRTLIKQILERYGLGPTHLLKAWDKGTTTKSKHEKSTLTRDEFYAALYEFFKDEDPDLWQSEVFRLLAETFDEVRKEVKGGTLPVIGIVHLERWLDDSTLTTLPLKTPNQQRRQAARRRRLQEAAQPTVRVPTKIFDARAGIELAKAKAKMLEDAKRLSLRRRQATPKQTDWSMGMKMVQEVPALQRSTSAALMELPPLDAAAAYRDIRRFQRRHQGLRMPSSVASTPLLTRRAPGGHSFASFTLTRGPGGFAEKFNETHMRARSAALRRCF